MRLTIAMIWVLTKYHHLYVIERSLVEGVEYLAPWWEAKCCLILLTNKVGQLLEVWLLKLGGELVAPTLLHAYFFHLSVYFMRHLPVISSG